MSDTAPGARHRTWDPGRPVDLGVALGPHRRGAGDPTHRVLGVGPGRRWLRASRTPVGTALLSVVVRGGLVEADAWGDGADWTLEQLPRLLGADDDPTGFVPRPADEPLVAAHRARPHLRIGASDRVVEAIVPACLEQVVTGKEAFGAFRRLVRRYGERAPGPAREPTSPAWDLWVQPDAATWARVPSWEFLAAGVEERRSRTLVRVAGRGSALERTLGRPHDDVDRALRSFPGVGPWTSAETRQRAHGDPDAWSIGDYHVGDQITWALRGEKLGDDVALELLEPYRGHRYRVQLLLGAVGMPPRRGARRTLPSHTPFGSGGRS